jgi:hypothetical protein
MGSSWDGMLLSVTLFLLFGWSFCYFWSFIWVKGSVKELRACSLDVHRSSGVYHTTAGNEIDERLLDELLICAHM